MLGRSDGGCWDWEEVGAAGTSKRGEGVVGRL